MVCTSALCQCEAINITVCISSVDTRLAGMNNGILASVFLYPHGAFVSDFHPSELSCFSAQGALRKLIAREVVSPLRHTHR